MRVPGPLCLALVLLGVPASGQDITATATMPVAIPADGSSAALVVVKTTGPVASLTVSKALGGSIPMWPIGDGLYAVVLAPGDALAGYAPETVYRNWVGFMDLVPHPGDAPIKYQLFVNIDDPAIPDVAVRDLGASMRCSPHVVNIVVPGDDPWQSLVGSAEMLTSQFYGAFPDDYDFMNLVFSLPSPRANRFHNIVKQEVLGIGMSTTFDGTAPYGSAGRLLGVTRFPIDAYFDLAEPSALHELGHQWIMQLDEVPLLAAGLPHWPPSSLAHYIMGTSDANGQGVFFPWDLVPQAAGQYLLQPSPGVIPEYTPMDLYLMGLLEPASVPPFVVLDPPDQPLIANTTVTGAMVSVNDVIAAVGPRVPPASWPRNYNMATVVVSRLRPLSDREMAFFDYFTARAEAVVPLPYKISHGAGEAKPFALATQGRGTLATSLPCFGVAEKPNLPQYRAVCKHCPPLLIGLDDLIRTTPMRNEGLRRSLRAKIESAGEAYARADADTAANVLEAFLRELAAQSGRGVPIEAARSLDVLTRQIAQSLRIALPGR